MSGFDNSIVNAQNELIRMTMESPNYVPGTSGWTINKDGSAEFNNLTVRGTFQGLNFVLNNNGLFFYLGAPALGNLVLSITPTAGIDPYGNAYKTGFASYSASSNLAAVLTGASVRLYTDETIQNDSTVVPGVLTANSTYVGETNLWSGQASSGDTQAVLRTFSNLCNDPARVFNSGSEIDVSAAHFGITGDMFVQGAHGIFGRDAGWVTVGMASGWAGRGGGYPPFQVYRSPLIGGVTFTRGWVSTSNSTANGTTIATLGGGYYNSSVMNWVPCQMWQGTAVVNAANLGLQIGLAGQVILYGISTAGTIGINFTGMYYQDDLS